MSIEKAPSTRLSKVIAAVVVVVALSSASAYAGAQAADVGDPARPDPRAGSSSPTENTFVPITPCRVVNTQNPAGKFAVGETRSYRTQGNTSSQGGAASCGVPASATAVEVAITAVASEGNGYVKVFPAGTSVPNATFMSFTRSFNVINAGAVAIRPGTAANLSVKVYQQRTHVIVDVLGYYVPELFASVGGDGSLYMGNGVSSVTRAGTGRYVVRFNRSVVGCATVATVGSGYEGAPSPGLITTAGTVPAGGVYVSTTAANGTSQDSEFFLAVHC